MDEIQRPVAFFFDEENMRAIIKNAFIGGKLTQHISPEEYADNMISKLMEIMSSHASVLHTDINK